MHKILAAQAIVWIILTIFFMYRASNDGVPAWFALIASTICVGLGSLIVFLLNTVLS